MSLAIKLTIITGPHHRERYCIREKTSCIIGRASDCLVQLAGHGQDGLISRHHCQLDIDPPRVRVKDLDSTNGTFLNGIEVDRTVSAAEVAEPLEGVELHDGDYLTIGGMTLQMHVINCGQYVGASADEIRSHPCVPREEHRTEIPVCTGDCLQAGDFQVLSNGVVVFWRTAP
jgi:pSer/pThr/pTyr-binding forkhead associated (FHA) protein